MTGGCAFMTRSRPPPAVVGRSASPIASSRCRPAPRWCTCPAGSHWGGPLAARSLPRRKPAPSRSPRSYHPETCATDYRCLTAENIFLRRGEGAVPVSPACNAACLGCISEHWGDVDSPQTRLAFATTASEIAELAAWHLSANPANFVSFGQGCEGEPLTRGAALVEATRRIRPA